MENKYQKEYDTLIQNLGGNAIILEKPLKFRKTPHSKDIFIYEILPNYDVELYGDAKFTVLQHLRLINSRKPIVTKSQINIGKYYNDLIKKSQDYLKDSTISADKRLNVFQISSVIAMLSDKNDTDVARDIGKNFVNIEYSQRVNNPEYGKIGDSFIIDVGVTIKNGFPVNYELPVSYVSMLDIVNNKIKVLTTIGDIENSEQFASEAELFVAVNKIIKDNTFYGYNIINWDFDYLKHRMKRHNMDLQNNIAIDLFKIVNNENKTKELEIDNFSLPNICHHFGAEYIKDNSTNEYNHIVAILLSTQNLLKRLKSYNLC
jgi:DNA polymerase elongation subunit (family B)